MLQNAYFLAKIGADTAENEQHFAEIGAPDSLGPRRMRALQIDPNVRQPAGLGAELLLPMFTLPPS